jgi:hypothetical protein
VLEAKLMEKLLINHTEAKGPGKRHGRVAADSLITRAFRTSKKDGQRQRIALN